MTSVRTCALIFASVLVCQVMTAGCGDDGPGPDSVPEFAVTSAFPNTGPTGSAVEVRVSGIGFQAGAIVTFDGIPANAVVADSRTITAVAPPHPEGAADIVVTNPDGKSVKLTHGYTYVPVAIHYVTPNKGFAGIGLTIGGSGFLPGALVTLGGIHANNVKISSSQITISAPAHDPGAVDVVVTNPDGQRGTLAGGFLYAAVSLMVTPGVVAPGGQLQVSWTTPVGLSLDWIGLFIVGGSNFDYLDYQYTNGGPSGTQTWFAPTQPGLYEFRYLPNDGYSDVARSSPVTVAGSASAASGGVQTTIRRAGRGSSPRRQER